jgi:transmembrane sensor
MSRTPEALMRAIQEAAEWNQRLEAGDLDDVQRREYSLWMQTPLHQAEMGRVCLIDTLLHQAPLSNEPASRPDNVIDFESYAPMTRPRVKQPPPPERKSRLGLKWVAGAVAAGLVIGFVMVGKTVQPVAARQTIVTTVGAWDKKLMDDGSVLYAGPQTELTFHRDGRQRTVVFARGEAFFDVASDPAHPFVVTTDFGSVRVLGTEFLVAYKGDSVVITVREGKVGVTPLRAPDSMQPTATLVANQQVVMSSAGVRGPVAVDAERESMWVRNSGPASRRLSFRRSTRSMPNIRTERAPRAEPCSACNGAERRVSPPGAALRAAPHGINGIRLNLFIFRHLFARQAIPWGSPAALSQSSRRGLTLSPSISQSRAK